MTDQISIVNRALLRIGARAQVSSLNEGSTEANACAILFTPTFEALARTARWGCLGKQVALTIIAAAKGTPENPTGTAMPLPPVPWQYSYAYPADCLFVRMLVPSLPSGGTGAGFTTFNNQAPLTIPGQGQIPYTVAYGTDATGNPQQIILTNQDQAQGLYTVNQPNPVIWDSLFQEAMVASLAAYLVPALSLNLALMSASIKVAEQAIALARASDGNESPHSQNREADWIVARAGSMGLGCGYLGNFQQYAPMIWPG